MCMHDTILWKQLPRSLQQYNWIGCYRSEDCFCGLFTDIHQTIHLKDFNCNFCPRGLKKKPSKMRTTGPSPLCPLICWEVFCILAVEQDTETVTSQNVELISCHIDNDNGTYSVITSHGAMGNKMPNITTQPQNHLNNCIMPALTRGCPCGLYIQLFMLQSFILKHTLLIALLCCTTINSYMM